uniref:DUF7390 domain-containing protein n=1 Tax=Salmonella phage vB_SEnST11_KE23 TaxID=3161174 RepID=A0AAU8GHN1_9CAUD
MASYSRNELVNKFRKELEDWNNSPSQWQTSPKDTTHIQMASLDEVMSAYGYAPRRLPNFQEVRDGRFGYYLVDRSYKNKMRPVFLSLQDAVIIHNGNGYRGNPFRRLGGSMSFALQNRIVEQVAIQRDKSLEGGIKSTKKWIKFHEEK